MDPAVVTRSVLPTGQFLGARSRGIAVAGFQIDLRVATLPPEQVALHSHDDAHFVLALDGGYRSLAHDPLTGPGGAFGAGALVWNPAGVEHRDCFDEAGGRFLSISFRPIPGTPHGEPLRLRGRPEAMARRLVGVVARFSAGDALTAEGLALSLAAEAHGSLEFEDDPAPAWVSRARQVIGDLATRPGLEVRAVAEAVGVHPVSLARRYRRHFGQSPAAAIRQARVERAAARVARGADLAAIAIDAGFADQSHMTREFVALYGLTPGRYRAVFS